MNLFIPSVGRKRFLIEGLRSAARRRKGRVFGSDLAHDAPALSLVDERVGLPAYGADGYWSAVDQLIMTHEITAIIPVRDAELVGWAQQSEAERFQSQVILSPSNTLHVCRDKALLYRLATSLGISCPAWELLSVGATPSLYPKYPRVIKPRFGSGSTGVSILRSHTDLTTSPVGPDGDYLVQAFVEGLEYSIDCYARIDGSLVACSPRKRLKVIDGECVVGEVVDDLRFLEIAQTLMKALFFRGVFNIQVIVGPDGPQLIDLNPRFPGGIAVTEAAGLPFIEWTVRELCGEPLAREDKARRPG